MRRKSAILSFLLVASYSGGIDAQNGRTITKLPTCAARLIPPPASWPRIDLVGSHVTFQVPPGVAKSPNVEDCIHGCEEWSGDGTSVLVSYGYWGESSFDDDSWKSACRVARVGFSLVLMPSPDERTVVIWPVRDGMPTTLTDFVVRVGTAAAPASVTAEQLAGSVRLK